MVLVGSSLFFEPTWLLGPELPTLTLLLLRLLLSGFGGRDTWPPGLGFAATLPLFAVPG